MRGITKAAVTEALAYGQALAALNCQFEGARGAMYQLPKKKFAERVTELQSRSMTRKTRSEIEKASPDRVISTKVCPSCLDHKTEVFQRQPKDAAGHDTEYGSVAMRSK